MRIFNIFVIEFCFDLRTMSTIRAELPYTVGIEVKEVVPWRFTCYVGHSGRNDVSESI